MSVGSLFHDLMLLGTFLLAGFVIRELVRPLQKLFIPSAVIGGALALVMGQQVLGVTTIPSSFERLSGVLINLIMTAIVFGVTINRQRIKSYVDYTAVIATTYGAQLAVGVTLGAVLTFFWTDLPHAWGIMGVFSFWGGHGTAASAGAVFQEMGVEDNLGMGMILSTVGLIVAIVAGMMMANWGLRRNKAAYFKVDAKTDDSVYRGPLPPELRKPIGLETVSSAGINSLALQLALMMFCMYLGGSFFGWIKAAYNINIPVIVHGMLAAILLWPLLLKLNASAYVDKTSINNLSGLCLELVICSAVATIRLDLVTTFIVPILIYSIIIGALSVFLNLWAARRFCSVDWFEKGITAFGQGTGNTSTGLALLRCVDPDLRSSATEACGIGTSLFIPIYGIMPAFAPAIAMRSIWYVVGIGLAILETTLVLGRVFLWQK
ncbi:MAG: hypothetical protein LUC93_12300 [Planctomycetaceae bacterium]|nr:hypothetical protein [Planctomycetaceae bacterium]